MRRTGGTNLAGESKLKVRHGALTITMWYAAEFVH